MVGTGTGVVNTPDGLFPWTSTAKRDCRLVACGLRVRYAGTELDRGGITVPVHANAFGDSLRDTDVNTALQRPSTKSYPCERVWRGVALKPCSPSDYTYSLSAFNSNDPANLRMGVVINAKAGTVFEYEIVRYFEAVPTCIAGTLYSVPGTSKSHSDLGGLSMVRDFIGGLASSDMGKTAVSDGYKFFRDNAAEMASGAVRQALFTAGGRRAAVNWAA